ncbi:YeeE/YedE family protein [Sulfuriferula sp. GW1]|uniref:YeeE/YedE family protein n=1 Tax=Sulfuriferula sp. GW1 TaxID=3345111 RepID=UPI0039AEB196
MIFDTFQQGQSMFLWLTFGIALIMGAVVNKTNFCTMGAVSDWVNMGDTGRMRSWLLAIAVALLGVVVLEYFGKLNPDASFPPYRSGQLIWAENLLGGLMFGIGMTLASGCGNKSLVRAGAGNLKSIVVVLIIGVIAYYMTNPFPNSDKTLFSVLFNGWIRPLAINVGAHQDLGTLLAGAQNAVKARLIIGGILGLALLVYVFKSVDFRSNRDLILGGLVVGLAVLAAWYVTSNVSVMVDGSRHTLLDYGQQWDFLANSDAGKPADIMPLSPQSFTFINPMGQMLGYGAAGFNKAFLTFGIMAVLGVAAGSFLWSVVSRSFRIEWFASFKDFVTHVIGAVLMGFGGVLAMGCTIGQGVTGVSTLALGSFIAFFAIVAGSAITMKIQYMIMMREA